MLPHVPQVFEFIHIKSLKDLPHLLMVLLLVAGIGLGVYLAMQPQLFNKRADEGTALDIKFIPEVIKAEPGKTYEVKIAINPKGKRVSAAQLVLSYPFQAISILEVKSGGFLPVELRVHDDLNGKLTLIYGSTIESQANQPGMLSTISFKLLNPEPAAIQIEPTSEVSVSEVEGNVLTVFPKLVIEPSNSTAPGEEVQYPDNLLLEKAFFASSEPAIRDFKEIIEPKPEIKPERVKPGFSSAFIIQLGTDIFISPISALNQVIEEKVGEIINRSE